MRGPGAPACSPAGFGHFFSFFRKRFYVFIVRERVRGREGEGNINVWLPLTHLPTGDLARNPGMCTGWESNRQPFGSQARAQSTGPHQLR